MHAASGRVRRAAVSVALCLVAGRVLADEPAPRRTLAVTGQGEVKVAPDLAVLSFAVETTARDAGTAVAENARKSTALADAIKKQIGSKDKVTTTRYSLDTVYQQPERGSTAPPQITGYVVRNQVRVETHAIDAVGKLIDSAATAGANRIDGLDFTLEQRDAAQADALQRAGQDARRQAESAATALGVRLGRVASATTSTGPIVSPRPYPRMMAMAEAHAPTPVEAGEVTVSATLQVTYEIE